MALYKIVLTSGASTYTYSDERILSISHPETPDSQTAEVTLANGDNVLSAISLKGYKAVISYENTAGGGYAARPPLWVIDQRFDSWKQGLVCTLYCEGKSNLIAKDHASADYKHDATSTKVIGNLATPTTGMIAEILSGTAVSEELTESQLLAGSKAGTATATTTNHLVDTSSNQFLSTDVGKVVKNTTDSTYAIVTAYNSTSDLTLSGDIMTINEGYTVSDTIPLYGANKVIAGQKIFLNQKTVTSLSFKLSKVGSPTGTITFRIRATAGDVLYQSKSFGDASTLTTTPTFYEVVWTTPSKITDVCYLYVDYSGGDVSNYVVVSYKDDAVKSGECLMDFINSFVEYADKDCAYQYQYTSTGIGVFSHCTAHTVTIDTEDTIIDTYTPCDGYSIAEGETRESAVKRLLQFTSEVVRVEADENFHVFVPTTSGVVYDESFTDAQFWTKARLDGLVIPNYIIVHSYPNDVDQYTGYYTNATSYALVPIRDSRQMTLVSNAQATSIATAIISQLQVSRGKGSALVPLNNTAQVYDYIKVADSAEGATYGSLIGNISYIRRIVKANVGKPAEFRMEIVVGGVPKGGVLAGKTPLAKFMLYTEPHKSESNVTWGELDKVLETVGGYIDDLIEHINTLYYGLWEAGVDVQFLKNDTEDRGGINKLIISQLVTYSTKDYVDGIERIMCIKPIAYSTALTLGDALDIETIPAFFNGWVLCGVEASVDTVSSSGTVTIQIRNVTDSVDMLSTAITIDATERNSSTAATPAVIDLTKDDVATGDRIAIDIDGAGTGTKGLEVKLRFRIEG